MRACIAAMLVFSLTASVGRSEQPSKELVEKLTAVIRKQCPDAEFKLEDNSFIAKHQTMTYTLHSHAKTGEVSEKTYQKEGPNYKGFLLTVTWQHGAPVTQAETPQTLEGPYFPTFIDDPATEDGQNHYWVALSYGKRIDKKLKSEILEALPKARFKDDERPNRESEEESAPTEQPQGERRAPLN